MADDIVTRLRCLPVDCDGTCWTCMAADEIVRLRAEVEHKADYAERMDALAEERLIALNAERALADQLAVALLGTASGRIIPTDDEWAGVVKMRSAALDAWEARRG